MVSGDFANNVVYWPDTATAAGWPFAYFPHDPSGLSMLAPPQTCLDISASNMPALDFNAFDQFEIPFGLPVEDPFSGGDGSDGTSSSTGSPGSPAPNDPTVCQGYTDQVNLTIPGSACGSDCRAKLQRYSQSGSFSHLI
jgi:hypothetical protein